MTKVHQVSLICWRKRQWASREPARPPRQTGNHAADTAAEMLTQKW